MSEFKPLPVELVALVEEENSPSPIVVLHHRETNRILPIWIGDTEARAIAIILNGIPIPRPLTHQLILNSVQAMGGRLLHIVVDRIEDQTYYATLHVDQQGKLVKIDARPSDSIALALHAKVPIFVEKSVMDAAGQVNPFPVSPPKYQQEGPRKIQLTKQDIERLSETLKMAREREEKS